MSDVGGGMPRREGRKGFRHPASVIHPPGRSVLDRPGAHHDGGEVGAVVDRLLHAVDESRGHPELVLVLVFAPVRKAGTAGPMGREWAGCCMSPCRADYLITCRIPVVDRRRGRAVRFGPLGPTPLRDSRYAFSPGGAERRRGASRTMSRAGRRPDGRRRRGNLVRCHARAGGVSRGGARPPLPLALSPSSHGSSTGIAP